MYVKISCFTVGNMTTSIGMLTVNDFPCALFCNVHVTLHHTNIIWVGNTSLRDDISIYMYNHQTVTYSQAGGMS